MEQPDPGLPNLPPCAFPREKGQSASHKDLRVPTLVGQTMALTRSKNGLITESRKGWYPGKPGPQGSSAWSSRYPYWVLQMWEWNGEGRDNTPNRKQLSWGLPSTESSKRNRITPLVPTHPLFSLGVRGHTDLTVFLHHGCREVLISWQDKPVH